jgi:glycosyltransferase involved in cell wall biosynthesis
MFFLSTLESSGPTNVVYNIIKYLDREKFEPVVLTMSPEPAHSSRKVFEKSGVRVYSADLSRLAFFLKGKSILKNIVDDIDPDIIHGHSLRPDGFAARCLTQYPLISTIHADLQANYTDTYGNFIGSTFAATHLRALAKFNKVIACSKSVYNHYRPYFSNLDLIQNGVDTELFFPIDEKRKHEYRHKLQIPVDKKIFISVGSLSERKDPDTLIRGFLKANVSNAVLIVLGEGPLMKQLMSNYKSEHRIIFKGHLADPIPFLQASDYFLSASNSEGLPNSVIEALSCGLPACLSDIPSHQEILKINGLAGTTFRVKDVSELAQAMLTLTTTDYTSRKQGATAIIHEHLNAKKMSLLYQQTYSSLSNSIHEQ